MDTELSNEQAKRALIVKLAADILAKTVKSGFGGTKAVPASEILDLAEWIYDNSEQEDDEPEDDDETRFGSLLDGLLDEARARVEGRRPTPDEIDAFNVDFAKTEPDTPEAIATEVFHGFPAATMKAGFLTPQWRIKAVTKEDGKSGVALSVTDRETGKDQVFDAADDDNVQTVCADCTQRNRSEIASRS